MIISEGFSGPFAALNGQSSITARRPDIIRSLLTVGYPSRGAAVKLVGRWRARLLVAMATGYLTHDLRTTRYFRNLEQSEKVGVSFLFGEAFTHWYAQDRMNMKFLVHVQGLPGCAWAPSSAALTLKSGAALLGNKSRPDFIGFRRNERHVFESKGRLRKPAQAAVAKALGQVSRLITINGIPPTTRCASFFMFKQAGTEGCVIDPPSSHEGMKVSFEDRDAAAKAYAFFLDRDMQNLSDEVGEGYVGQEIEEGVFYAADKKVVEVLRTRPRDPQTRHQQFDDVLGMLAERAQAYAGRRDDTSSSGPDGTLLVDRRPNIVLAT